MNVLDGSSVSYGEIMLLSPMVRYYCVNVSHSFYFLCDPLGWSHLGYEYFTQCTPCVTYVETILCESFGRFTPCVAYCETVLLIEWFR